MNRFVYPQDLIAGFNAGAAPTPKSAPAPAPKTPNTQISDLVTEAAALIEKATKIADEHNIEFDWDVLGYGMGGTYRPQRMTRDEALALIGSDAELTVELRNKIVALLRDDSWNSSYQETGWISSSSQC